MHEQGKIETSEPSLERIRRGSASLVTTQKKVMVLIHDFMTRWKEWVIHPFTTSYELFVEEDIPKLPFSLTGFLIGALSMFIYVTASLLIYGMWITPLHALQILLFIGILFVLDLLFIGLFNFVMGGRLLFGELVGITAFSMIVFVLFLLLIPVNLIGLNEATQIYISLAIIGVHWFYLVASVSGANHVTSPLFSFLGWAGSVAIFSLSLFLSGLLYPIIF